MKLICVGDNVCDCYIYEKKYYPGGNCVNVAVNAKRNGAEAVSYLGIFGNDEMAAHIKDCLEKEGVDYSKSREMVGRSGQPGVNIDEHGDRIFVRRYTDTVQTMAKLRLVQSDLDEIQRYDLFHTSCYSFLEEELSKVKDLVKVSYDFSLIENIEEMLEAAPYIDYAFVSASDTDEKYRQEQAKLLLDRGVELVCMTRGSKACEVHTRDKIYTQEPLQTEVVDTMGAGDSFIAGFLVAYMDGKSIEDALLNAAESARRTCQISGGFGYPKELRD